MLTLKHISQELQLSVATVSRALTNSKLVSPVTRSRVQALAQQLGYQPNAAAVTLRKGDSTTIGVITPHLGNNFFGQILMGIEEVVHAAGYRLLVCQSNDSAEREAYNVKMLLNARVAGILMAQASSA